MKVTEHTIITQRKRHPNDVRYPCRGTHEIMDAGRKLITSLSDDERDQMLAGDLILDEEETAELYDAVEVDDVIGLGIFRRTGHPQAGFNSNMYKVVKIHEGDDFMECENMFSKETEEISFQDFSIALAMNLAEILYREDKPFGISNEEEWTIKIHEKEEDEEDSATGNNSGNATQNQPASADSSDEASTSGTEQEVQSEPVDEIEAMKDFVTETFKDLGMPGAFSFDADDELAPERWTRGRKLDHHEIVALNNGDVVWVHYTDEYGKTKQDGPLRLDGKDPDEYAFGDGSSFVHPVPMDKASWDPQSMSIDNCGHIATIYEATPVPLNEAAEASAEEILAKELDPQFFSKREKLSRKEIKSLKSPDVVWVHRTNNLGAVTFNGPACLLQKINTVDGEVYEFVDHASQTFEIEVDEGWDDYAEHFRCGGSYYMLFKARDRRPKNESENSKNDDTEKLIKAMGLDKKAEEEDPGAETPPLKWADCYYAFAWDEGTYCVVVTPKAHWDKYGSFDDGKATKHLIDQVGLAELQPGIYEYSHVYSETQLRTLFKSFNVEEKPEMAENMN